MPLKFRYWCLLLADGKERSRGVWQMDKSNADAELRLSCSLRWRFISSSSSSSRLLLSGLNGIILLVLKLMSIGDIAPELFLSMRSVWYCLNVSDIV